MMKKDFTNPLVILSIILITATLALFCYYYFIKPIEKNNIVEEIEEKEQKELKILAESYLKQNPNLQFKWMFQDIKLNEYAVAGEYLYAKKGLDVLDKYEEILDTAKTLFDDKKVEYRNFTVNLDECGREKYSTIEGLVYSDKCDLQELVYEIGNIYKQGELFVVEFYGTVAKEKVIDGDHECDSGEKSDYNLTLTSLENYEYENNNYLSCSPVQMGIFYLKDDIITKMKKNNYKYKLEFKKDDQNFIFYNLKK